MYYLSSCLWLAQLIVIAISISYATENGNGGGPSKQFKTERMILLQKGCQNSSTLIYIHLQVQHMQE